MTVFEQDNKWLTLTATTCNSIVRKPGSEAVSFPDFVLMGKLPNGCGSPKFLTNCLQLPAINKGGVFLHGF